MVTEEAAGDAPRRRARRPAARVDAALVGGSAEGAVSPPPVVPEVKGRAGRSHQGKAEQSTTLRTMFPGSARHVVDESVANPVRTPKLTSNLSGGWPRPKHFCFRFSPCICSDALALKRVCLIVLRRRALVTGGIFGWDLVQVGCELSPKVCSDGGGGVPDRLAEVASQAEVPVVARLREHRHCTP